MGLAHARADLVIWQVFLITNIRFCDFLTYHGLLRFKPWSRNWKAFRREMPKSNSLQKAVFYVATFDQLRFYQPCSKYVLTFQKLHILARFTCTAAFSRKVRSRAISREITIAQYIIACFAEVYFKPHNVYQ